MAGSVVLCQWGRQTADGGLESSTVDGSVTLFAGMYQSRRCSPVLESEPDILEPGLGPFLIAYSENQPESLRV